MGETEGEKEREESRKEDKQKYRRIFVLISNRYQNKNKGVEMGKKVWLIP
jgi:hypothetical protein